MGSASGHLVIQGQDPGVSWVVLADPEGNEFCLLSEPAIPHSLPRPQAPDRSIG